MRTYASILLVHVHGFSAPDVLYFSASPRAARTGGDTCPERRCGGRPPNPLSACQDSSCACCESGEGEEVLRRQGGGAPPPPPLHQTPPPPPHPHNRRTKTRTT